MEKELQEEKGRTHHQQKEPQGEQEEHQLEPVDGDVFQKKHSEDVSDREIRALCLHDHHLVSDEDRDCVVLDGNTVLTAGHDDEAAGALILAESTSSSPILTGTAQPPGAEGVASAADFLANSVNRHHSAAGNGGGGWQLKRVFVEAEDLITPANENEEVDDAAAVVEESRGAKIVQGEEERKSGLSRCVATGNLVAAGGNVVEQRGEIVGKVSGGEKGNDECTCREEDQTQQNKSAKCGDVVDDDDDDDEDQDQCSSCGGGGDEGMLLLGNSDRDAIRNQFNGVQLEQGAAKQMRVVDFSCDSAPASDNTLRDNAAKTTDSTAPSSSVVIIGREGDNNDDPLFYSVVNDSGGSSSQTTKTQTTLVVAPHSKVNSGCNSLAVLTKQQTPTSVRTATSSAVATGSFGKSEVQLENPKILSKRLQQLFRAAAPHCDTGDVSDMVDADGGGEERDEDEEGHASENQDIVVNKSQSVKLNASSSPALINSITLMDTTEGSGSARVVVDEETPSSSTSSLLRREEKIKEEKPDGRGDEEEVVVEEEELEMETENIPERLSRDNESGRVADGSASGPTENQQQRVVQALQDFEPENAWADCEEVGDESEEICTCQNYSDAEDAYDEDEQLPSKDVDLSGFTTHELLHDSHADSGAVGGGPPSTNGSTVVVVAAMATTPLGPGRKRKMSEAASSGMTLSVDSPQMYGSCLDVVQSKRCRGGKYSSSLGSPKTPTSTVGHIPAFLRTPRSAQSMHLMPRESLPAEMGLWLGQFQKWTEFDRVTALNHIIDLCEPSQVRHVMKVIEPQFQRDFISLLPRELALQVLSYLEPTDLLRAAQTCRNWRFLCDDNLLWKDKCKEGNIIIDVESDRPKRGRAGNMPPIASPWKAAYMRQHIIEMNWRSRPIRTPKVLKGHDDHVITCLQFCGNRIVSGSDDNTLKVWSAVTGKCLRVLMGHTGGVWSSQMSSKYIISGSTDRTLKVWNAETGHCEHTLYGHTSTVRCMHLHGEKVVSGSRDATLRVWDVNRGNCLHVLVGHLAAVRCVQYDGKLVVSGAYDYTVKVWNPERQECLHTLQGHTNRVYSLQFDGIHVVSGSLDTSIRVWDAESGSCKHTLMGHQSLTSGMELRDHILVSGNADSTVKIWDIVSGQCLQTLSGPNKHQSAVTCLQFNSRFVITSSDDGTVKLWDVKTGEFIRNLVALDSGGSGGVVWRIRASDTKLICAVGSRNGTEETKLMVLDFDVEGACLKCS